MVNSRYERRLVSGGIKLIAGIDESGRGPLAGPVVAACVILPQSAYDGAKDPGIDDCKKLSPKKREFCFKWLIDSGALIKTAAVEEKLIDSINIYQATIRAMEKAVKGMELIPEHLLIDGPLKLNLSQNYTNIIGGDGKSVSIAAASIVAKVTRDRIMLSLHEKWPEYGFDRHKGYPTREHINALKKYGPSPVHRRSFAPVKRVVECDL